MPSCGLRSARTVFGWFAVAIGVLVTPAHADKLSDDAQGILKRVGLDRGICVLLGSGPSPVPVEVARASELTVFVQLPRPEQVAIVRQAADVVGLLGRRVFVDQGSAQHIHLADNLADAVVLLGEAAEEMGETGQSELLRVVRPGGKLVVGDTELVKPFPEAADDWGHPYHGPDNNPQSLDRLAKAPYLTQFLAEPWYGPMPEVTLVSAGRMFKAFGHISFKEREWPLLNTLVAMNAYNGTMLWERKLRPGFMIHRNTMIATPDTLYLADDVSCKLIDPASGQVRDEIVAPDELGSGKVWKWMALEDGVLFALVGDEEPKAEVLQGTRMSPGWPWKELGKGYRRRDYPWGFGRTILAIDLASKELLWSHQEDELIDSRTLCMNRSRLFFYSHQKFLGCLEANTGKLKWKTSDKELLDAIGEHDRAQTPSKGYSSQVYAKCNEQAIYFAGPQRQRLVAASVEDGRLLWQYTEDGNFQLILRPDALYAMGRLDTSKKFDLVSGKILAELDCYRGNCTRATGTVDSIFSRGQSHSGTLRLDLSDDQPKRIGLMRPGCHDGVLVAGGLLYWGPWMCDCNLSLIGVISLGPAGNFNFAQKAITSERLQPGTADPNTITPLPETPGDWTSYRADNFRSSSTPVEIASRVIRAWHFVPSSPVDPTAPVAVGGLVFTSGSDGVVRAIDAATGSERWTSYTGGRVYYSPAYAKGRLFVGSADGWVYAFEAATGRLLWRFRAAPAERKIPVYGRLCSTWPVASGVLADQDTLYAAAGIASYDGTHIYALNMKTGAVRWQNNTSGRLVDEELLSGVSVQGHLLLQGGRLYMAGGNVISPAIYDTRNGKCLNVLRSEWFRDVRPGQTLSSAERHQNFLKAPRGRELFLVNNEVRVFDQLLYSPKRYQAGRYFADHFLQASSENVLIRGRADRIVRLASGESSAEEPKALWESRALSETTCVVLAANAVLVSGKRPDGEADSYALAALDLEDGREIWSMPLPGAPARWGMAVDGFGQIVTALEDGSIVCFGPEQAGAE